VNRLMKEGLIKQDPIIDGLAAISVGIHKEVPILDLCYLEDSAAEVDANFVMTSSGKIIEVSEKENLLHEKLMKKILQSSKGNLLWKETD